MKLHVTIDWCKKNYSASLATEGLGAVIATAKTEADAIKKFQEAFDFHIEENRILQGLHTIGQECLSAQ